MGVTVLYPKSCYLIAGVLLLCSSGMCEAVNATGSSNSTNTTGSDAGGKIVGGVSTTIEEFPWQVSLHRKPGGFYDQFCGGSILSARLVLTAAHCVEGEDPTDLLVIAKVTNLQTEDGSKHEVAEIITHWKYNNDIYDNDIALLKLDSTIELDAKAAIVNLPDTSTPRGQELYVTGWGSLSSGGEFPDILQKVVVYSVTNRKCRRKYCPEKITRQMMCAAEKGKDSCQGDSGGPLVRKDTNILVGIVSWGKGCAKRRYPGVYTKVSRFIRWINEKSMYLLE